MLCAAVADGRLTLSELDERVGAALSARTLSELAALIADLSTPANPSGPVEYERRAARDRGVPVRDRGVPRDRGVSGRPGGERVNTADRWALLQSLAERPPRANATIPR